VVAAAQEERFSRLKHDAGLPVRAFRYCLEAAGLAPCDLDCVAYYERPVDKLARQLWAQPSDGSDELRWLDPNRPYRAIRERLGYEGPIVSFPHHASHAASAFLFSGLTDAAVLTVDGVGEWATTTYSRASGPEIELLAKVEFPHSLGLLYSALTSYLGFEVNDGEGKVMGLAPYGEPVYLDALRRLVDNEDEGPGFELDLDYFDFLRGRRMYSAKLCELLGHPPRRPGEPLDEFHQHVARSTQELLEEILLSKVRYLARRATSRNLCLAGGVALNCVANGRLLRESPFERLFVQPASGDAGGCLGAAALASVAAGGGAPRPLKHVFLGPSWTDGSITGILDSAGIGHRDFSGREDDLVRETAKRLARGEILGWFQGRMEFGPRALGARSILADPADAEARARLNTIIKRREAFRPFAPSVTERYAETYFDLGGPSPFMLRTCQVRPDAPLLPAVTHVDGSARPQTVGAGGAPRFAALLEAFAELTEHPVLLNTSFNVAGEPIVASPVDALLRFGDSDLDALVLGEHIVEHSDLAPGSRSLLAAWSGTERANNREPSDAPDGDLYTFV
jgi:carbamoyltransferase